MFARPPRTKIGWTRDSNAGRRSVAPQSHPMVIALTLLGLCTSACRDATHRGQAAGDSRTPAKPRVVSFAATDSGVVYADESGDGPRAVVLAHGGRFTKESWEDQAAELTTAGFRVLAIDFRGRGQSGGGTTPADDDRGYVLDVLAAVRYLRDSGAERVSIVGASFGGWAAAEAAIESQPDQIDRLVLLAHSPVEHPERITGRKLFIIARDDPKADGTPRLVRFREQYERAPEPKELLILEGDAHAQFIFDTDQASRLMSEILRFLTAP